MTTERERGRNKRARCKCSNGSDCRRNTGITTLHLSDCVCRLIFPLNTFPSSISYRLPPHAFHNEEENRGISPICHRICNNTNISNALFSPSNTDTYKPPALSQPPSLSRSHSTCSLLMPINHLIKRRETKERLSKTQDTPNFSMAKCNHHYTTPFHFSNVQMHTLSPRVSSSPRGTLRHAEDVTE